MTRSAAAMTALAALTVLAITMIALASPAMAGSASAGPSLSEIRDAQRFTETQHTRKLREVEEGLQAQTLDADAAVMMRSRIERDYKRDMDGFRQAEDSALRSLDARNRPKSASEERAPSAAIPRFQSQSVITYPQNGAPSGDDEAPAEKSHREGEQKNVGFGTRELSF